MNTTNWLFILSFHTATAPVKGKKRDPMQLTRTDWPDDALDGCVNLPSAPCVGRTEQPSFGISIGWNEPDKLWKPFIAIHFWHWLLQIGWLIDLKGEEDAQK
jgi:hypothetical protein